MIVDTSAIVAVLKQEAESARCIRALSDVPVCRISAANLLEGYMVIDRTDLTNAMTLVDRFMVEFLVQVEPVTVAQIALAREAFHRFGPGSEHGARLNYGDCFACALAKVTGEPLLLVGNDFSQTDIGIA